MTDHDYDCTFCSSGAELDPHFSLSTLKSMPNAKYASATNLWRLGIQSPSSICQGKAQNMANKEKPNVESILISCFFATIFCRTMRLPPCKHWNWGFLHAARPQKLKCRDFQILLGQRTEEQNDPKPFTNI